MFMKTVLLELSHPLGRRSSVSAHQPDRPAEFRNAKRYCGTSLMSICPRWMGQKRRIIRLFSASPFNPTKIPCNGQRIFSPAGRPTVLCVDTSGDRVWDAAVPARPAPEFRGFRRPSGDLRLQGCVAGRDLASSQLASPEAVSTRIYPYNRQQTSLRIAPCGSGVLSLMYFQNGDK